MSSKGNAKKKGKFRSGFEYEISTQLKNNNVKYEYEAESISYVLPAKNKKYIVDFRIFNGVKFIYIEVKGIFDAKDRAKHLLLKEQRPDLDIRIVFQNANARISKKSRTTYGDWCQKNGIVFAHKEIPKQWFKEF